MSGVREILEQALDRLLALRQTHYVTAAVIKEHQALDADIRQALAALDAEGVGLPRVSVEERLPDEEQSDGQ